MLDFLQDVVNRIGRQSLKLSYIYRMKYVNVKFRKKNVVASIFHPSEM